MLNLKNLSNKTNLKSQAFKTVEMEISHQSCSVVKLMFEVQVIINKDVCYSFIYL